MKRLSVCIPGNTTEIHIPDEFSLIFLSHEKLIEKTATSSRSRQLDDDIMTETGALASLSTALTGLSVSSRKPDLPPFDKNAIEKWIRRVESAYIRSGISSPAEKFAFIESKFPVDEDPAVDEFLFGPATNENWEAFCSYLRRRYGKTKRQKTAALLEPIQMDGRTPSQYYAKLCQNFDDITLDDIVKEVCIRQLPVDLQQTVCKDIENLGAKDMMEFADKFYNPDGSRLHKKPPSVNAVRISNPPSAAASASAATAYHANYSQPFQDNDDDNDEVNAIRGRQNSSRGNQNGFSNSRSKSRSRFGNNNSEYNNNNASRNNSGGNNDNGNYRNNSNNNRREDPSLCFYHNAFGDRARKCDIGCARAKPGNGQSPRQ